MFEMPLFVKYPWYASLRALPTKLPYATFGHNAQSFPVSCFDPVTPRGPLPSSPEHAIVPARDVGRALAQAAAHEDRALLVRARRGRRPAAPSRAGPRPAPARQIPAGRVPAAPWLTVTVQAPRLHTEAQATAGLHLGGEGEFHLAAVFHRQAAAADTLCAAGRRVTPRTAS